MYYIKNKKGKRKRNNKEIIKNKEKKRYEIEGKEK